MQRPTLHRPAAIAATAALPLALAAPPAIALPLDVTGTWASLWHTALHPLGGVSWLQPPPAEQPGVEAKNGPQLDPVGSPAAGQEGGDGDGEVTGHHGPEWDPYG